MILYVLVVCIAIFSVTPAFAIVKADRITDREIIESLAELKAGQKALERRIDGLDKRIDGLDKRIDGLQSLMLGGFGILISGMMALVGFVLWDRRTALAPTIRKTNEIEEKLALVLQKTREVEEREALLEKAIKDYAQQEPKLYEALKRRGLGVG